MIVCRLIVDFRPNQETEYYWLIWRVIWGYFGLALGADKSGRNSQRLLLNFRLLLSSLSSTTSTNNNPTCANSIDALSRIPSTTVLFCFTARVKEGTILGERETVASYCGGLVWFVSWRIQQIQKPAQIADIILHFCTFISFSLRALFVSREYLSPCNQILISPSFSWTERKKEEEESSWSCKGRFLDSI